MRKYLFFLGALLMIAPAISEARVYCKSTNTGRFCTGLSTDTKPTVAETNDEFWETDTKDLYKYAGAAWSLYVNNSSASGGESENIEDADFVDGTTVGTLVQGVAEVSSPTAVTEGDVGAFAMTLNRALKSSLYTPLGQSAMDDTADAVKVLNYVSENNTTGTSTNVAATALGVGGAGVELIDGYDLGAIAATYCTLAITNSADGAIDAAKIYLLPSGETNLTAPNVLGGSTGVTSAHFTAPAVGSPLEWATTWVTSTGVIGDGDLTDLAASSVWVGRLKVAGADKLYVEISGDGAVDTTYRLSCN